MPTITGNQISYGSGGYYRAEIVYSTSSTSTTTTFTWTCRVYHSTSLYDSTNNGARSGDWGSASFSNVSFSSGSAATKTIATGTYSVTRSYAGDQSKSVTFYYENLAEGSGGGGRSTVTATLTVPQREYGTPSAPGTPSISAISTGSATFSWTSPSDWGGSGENRYRYEYEQVGGGSATGTTANRTITISPAYPGGTYRFRVQAYNDNLGNGGGASSWTSWVTWTNPPNPPSIPQSVSVTNITATSARGLWSAPADWGGQTGSYIFEFRQGTTVIRSGGPSTSPQDVTGLTPGVAYNFRVQSYNDGGASAWVQVDFTTLALPQDAPVLSLDNAGPVGAALSWTPISNWGAATGTYSLRVSADPTFSTGIIAATGLTATSYTIPQTLQPNTTYYAEVWGVNTSGAGPKSNTLSWMTSAPPVFVKVSGTWRSCSAIYIKISGTWRAVTATKVKVSGAWR